MSTLPATGFDLGSPEVLAEPDEVFARMRAECPVFHDEAINTYVLTRYEDVRTAAAQPLIFSSHRPIFGSGDPELEAIAAQGWPEIGTMTSSDPPEHTRYRKLVNRAFSPKAVAALEPVIRDIVNGLIDGFIEAGEVEFVMDFAKLVPGYFMADALGVPRAEQATFIRWVDEITLTIYGAETLTRAQQLAGKQALVDFQHYFAAHIEDRRAHPTDDMISHLVHATVDGEESLSVPELLDLIRILLIAGNETTASWIEGSLLLLLDHPEVLGQVRADRSLLPQVLEESLRLITPSRYVGRTIEGAGSTMHDTEICPGARARLVWHSANHDPEKFEDPHAFDIERDTGGHLAFGFGTHYCIGANLARAEARIAFEVILDRLGEIELTVPREEVRHLPMAGLTRLDRLPLRFVAR